MCGIVGELGFKGARGAVSRVLDALATIRHRGPDQQGTWSNDGIALGICRLSIIDITGGAQPIRNEDGTLVIVYNGELYNFLDLRPVLEARGHRFSTRGDTEVVLHAYEEWGTDCLKHFNGMFAFAIWDERKHQLFIARDRIGEKPLYYQIDGTRFVFASEIKALLKGLGVTSSISRRGLANYLAFGHAVAPYTMYESVRKLRPGHYLLVSEGSAVEHKYWDVGDEPQIRTRGVLSDEEYSSQVRELLEDSVRKRMISDVPVGAFLSGGVDSTAILALMQKHSSRAVKTFSLGFHGFGNGGAYNELSEARQAATVLGTEHHELEVSHLDLRAVLSKLVYHFDEPFSDPAAFPVYLLSEFARRQVKVVLTGDGGDELFGGYRRYAVDRTADAYQVVPRFLREGIVPLAANLLPRFRRIKRTVRTLAIGDPGRRYAEWLRLFSADVQAELLSEQYVVDPSEFDPAQILRDHYDQRSDRSASEGFADDHLNRLMYVDLKTWLPDTYLEKNDKTTMACSLEARVPLLDHRLVELAFQIPGRMKVKRWTLKHVFKQAVKDLVPAEILRRPKHGFAVPIDPWLRGDLRSFAFEVLFDRKARERGIFNLAYIERLWREHEAGRHVWDQHLWLLLNFELWSRAFIDE